MSEDRSCWGCSVTDVACRLIWGCGRTSTDWWSRHCNTWCFVDIGSGRRDESLMRLLMRYCGRLRSRGRWDLHVQRRGSNDLEVTTCDFRWCREKMSQVSSIPSCHSAGPVHLQNVAVVTVYLDNYTRAIPISSGGCQPGFGCNNDRLVSTRAVVGIVCSVSQQIGGSARVVPLPSCSTRLSKGGVSPCWWTSPDDS